MLAAHLTVALAAAPSPAAPPAHICWIESVVSEGAGACIRFAAGAPVRPDAASVHAEVGMRLYPTTSGRDGCILTVARRGGTAGVLAEAHLFLPQIMTEPDVCREWIAATSARWIRFTHVEVGRCRTARPC